MITQRNTGEVPKFTRMSRFLAVGAAAAAAAGAWAGVASASTAPARHGASRQTISLYCAGGTSTFVNVAGKKAAAPGDEMILSKPCYNAAHRTQLLGYGYLIATLLAKDTAAGHAIVALQGGDVLLAGLAPFSRPSFTWAVTGGTGSYDGARGQATFTPHYGKGNPALITISLLP